MALCVWPKAVADFEYDWIRYLLPADCKIVNEEDKLLLHAAQPCVFVFNFWVPFKDIIATVNHDYGVIYLGDEMLSDFMDYFVNDPHCKFVWRNYFNPRYFKIPKVKLFPCAYKKGFGVEIPRDVQKEYAWSFAGAVHGPQRTDAINAFVASGLNPHKIHSTPPQTFNAAEGLSTYDYKLLIAQSKYVVCPPGNKIMECSRLYETLEGGAVPVVLDNYLLVTINPSYHHGVFPPASVVGSIPFIIAKSWPEAIQKVKNIEEGGEYETLLAKCKAHWVKCKAYWKAGIEKDVGSI